MKQIGRKRKRKIKFERAEAEVSMKFQEERSSGHGGERKWRVGELVKSYSYTR